MHGFLVYAHIFLLMLTDGFGNGLLVSFQLLLIAESGMQRHHQKP